MDVLAHTLWTNALFHIKYANQRKMRYLAAFFGVAPDLVGFTPLFFYLLFSSNPLQVHQIDFIQNSHWTFKFAEWMYNYSHSLVVFGVVTLFIFVIANLYLKRKQGVLYKTWYFWPILGWLLHILIDIPTHPDFYQTPLFFPISEFRSSHGVPWRHPVFMVVNYSLLALAYVVITIYQKRKQDLKQGRATTNKR